MKFGCGSRLVIYVVVFVHSTQKHAWTILAWSMLLYVSAKCLFFLSVTPLCCGVFRYVNCRHILLLSKNYINLYDIYSPLLSVQRHCMLTCFNFCFLLKVIKLLVLIRFFFYKIYPDVSRIVIDKCYHISITTYWWLFYQSQHVWVYQLQRHLSSKFRFLICQLVCFLILASNTYYVILSF